MITGETTRTFSPDGKYLIIHADDAGMCRSVNVATIAALQQGLVTSASIMAPAPCFDEFAAFARVHPEFDFGVHLTLTSEWEHYRWSPLLGRSRVPTLVDESGAFWQSVEEVVSNVDPRHVECELTAQIELVMNAGVSVSHLDTHQGTMFCRPDLVEIYFRLGDRYRVPVLLAETIYDDPRFAGNLSDVVDRRGVDRNNLARPWLSQLFQFDNTIDYAVRKQQCVKHLRNCGRGSNQLIIHCGFDCEELRHIMASRSAALAGDYRLAIDRDIELAVRELGIELTSWKEYFRSPRTER